MESLSNLFLPPCSPNLSALQPFQNSEALEVNETAFPHAWTHQVIIRNRAVAINPIDTLIQSAETSCTRT